MSFALDRLVSMAEMTPPIQNEASLVSSAVKAEPTAVPPLLRP